MDIDHVATVVFARWPGQSSPWYDSLRRIASYTTAVGTFETVDAYFKQTGMSGQCIIHKPDGYRSPYLRQAVDARQKDPISRWAAYYRTRALLDAARSMRLLELAAGAAGPDVDGETLARQIDAAVEHDAAHLDEIDETLTTAIDEARNRLADVLCSSDGPKGYMVVNPCGFTRRVLVDVSGLARIPATAAPVVAAGETRKGKQAMVEVPAMGFAWVGAAEASEPAAATRRGWFFRRKQSDSPPLAAENILQNEFFHVVIDRTAGSIRAVLDGVSRGPRLAQQIALRWPEGDENDPGHESHYTIMAADDVRITSAGPVVGEITSRGRLMDRTGRRRGGFVQMTRVSRGSRIIEIDIELDVPDVPTGNPWQSYYAARFAWSDESSRLYRGLQGVGVKTDETMIDAPEFLELQTDKTRTAILPGGLPYHRRLGYRRLDTLLVVPGESQRRFRLAAGIDCPSAAMAAVDFLTPVPVIGANAPPATHGWLFHIEGKSAVATHWQPIIEDNRLRGAVVRLLETEGRSVRFGVRSPQPLASAAQRGMGDAAACELPVAGDRAEVELRGYGWSEIELRFV
jgi:alpha-mannosidase